MRARQVLTLFGLLAALATPAGAQEAPASWYAGVAGGWLRARFEPNYTNIGTAVRSNFVNRASGLEVQGLVGRRWGVSDRFALGLRGAFAMNDFEWSLSLPAEPAEFHYSLPWTAVITAVPELSLGGRLAAAGELGAGIGRVHEVKTSPTKSSYDLDEPTALIGVGAGLKLRVSSRIGLTARWRHLRYVRSEFESHDPAGALVEQVSDAPRSNGVSLGVTARF